MKLQFGRPFDENDTEHRSPVVMLGYDTVRTLFPGTASDSIGQEITLEGQLFTVIGTMEKRRQGISGGSNPKDNDFAIFTSDYFLELWNKISGLIFILMFAVASVGLIAGGVGVMNIMLVSVTERTREIGVRKAIGAKRSNILAQFLIEAVTLSAVGGLIGVLLGSGLTLLLRYGLSVPATLSFFWIITALVLCAMIGIVFGVYPAWKAARLDPVEALRYE
jgi:putative ABC transport system permease protein